MLTRAFFTLRTRCIEGIRPNREQCERMVNNSIGIVTALLPEIGYKKASHCAKAALRENAAVTDIVLREGYLSKERLEAVMQPANMVGAHNPTLVVEPVTPKVLPAGDADDKIHKTRTPPVLGRGRSSSMTLDLQAGNEY